MKEAIQVGLNSIWSDFKGWGVMDRLWLAVAVGAIILSTLLMESNTLDIVTAIANVVCVLLVAKGRLSNFYWGMVGVVGMAVVAFNAKLYGTASLNVLFVGAQFWGWWTWYKSMGESNGLDVEVKVNVLTRRMMIIVSGLTVFFISIVHYYFAVHTDNPYPYADAAMLVLSLVGTVLMVKHYAEQWFFWITANLFCIYMWVLPALDGEGSMPIVVMWTVFTINSFIGFYKWVIVKDGK
jgi:nicotinamide mononucleotide transporter